MDSKLIIYQLPPLAQFYPTPKVPMLPVLDSKTLNFNPNKNARSYFSHRNTTEVPSGRIALYYALKYAGIKAGDDVLVPSYHCGSMIEPILWLEANPVFFNLDEKLEVTQIELNKRITPNVKSLLLTHFFGFPQDVEMIKNFCMQRKITLIEDCAHSYFTSKGNVKMGESGDFCIASTVKFFSGTEGGLLVENKNKTTIDLKPASFKSQLKHIKNYIEQSAQYNRLGLFGKLAKKLLISNANNKTTLDNLALINKYQCTTEETDVLHKHNLIWFDHTQIGMQPTAINKFVWKYTNIDNLISKRITNYNYYLQKLSGVKNIKFLHEQLPTGVVPYIFPLILDFPKKHFPILKLKGVPIWRWEELVLSDCEVSNNYRLKLIQIPCHQGLKPKELDWIINTIIETVDDHRETEHET